MGNHQDVFYLKTPLGALKISTQGHFLVGIQFVASEDFQGPQNFFQENIALQITEYFCLQRKTFQIPVCFIGTPFQKRVWEALSRIPFGKLTTYKNIAEVIDCPRGARAVGQAIHNNPIAIVIPCHRVIGKNGALTGYASGLERKRYLIDLERKLATASP